MSGHIIALGLAAAILEKPGPSHASPPSAGTFLAGIYEQYTRASGSRGVDYSNPTIVRRYFEPRLAKMILLDFEEAKKRKEVPNLNGDPFVDAQEWEIDSLSIDVRNLERAKAVGTVTFKNFGKPVKVLLDLVRLENGWRIAEIRYEGRRTLRDVVGRH